MRTRAEHFLHIITSGTGLSCIIVFSTFSTSATGSTYCISFKGCMHYGELPSTINLIWCQVYDFVGKIS